MNRRTERVSAAQAGANLAIVQSAVRVVMRCLLAVFFLEVLISAVRVALNIPPSLWFAVVRGVLMAVLLLPIFYRLVLRPVAELAASQAAAAAEARFEAIAQAAGDAIVIADVDWKLHFVNLAAEKMFGLQPGEWTKAPLESFLPEHTREYLEAARAEYRKTGKPVLSGRGMLELELLRGDGSRFPAELCVSELREGRQSLFVSMMRDISTRKQAERDIQDHTTRLNALIASSPLAIVVLDKNQRVQLCNAAFEAMFQYHSAEIAGLDLDPLVAPAFLMEEATGMTKRGVAGEPTHAITRRRRKDGSLVDVEIHSVPLLIGGQVEGAYAIYQDQTERNKLKLYEQILPVCCMCGKIRDDQGVESGEGVWDRLEHYITRHTDARLSHTFCPPCLEEYRKREGLPSGESSGQGAG